MDQDNIYRITLLRHAQSQGNVTQIPQGHEDASLTALGQEQAAALAERWVKEGKSFARIISSPLQRAQDTARLLAERLKVELETDELWLERDVGQMNGLGREEVRAHYGDPKSTSPYHDAFGLGGEGQWQLYLRAGQALHRLLNRPPAAYLVVSHGGILNALMYAIFGIAPQAFAQGPRFHFNNCGFSELSYEGGLHRWTLLGFNNIAHLKSVEENG